MDRRVIADRIHLESIRRQALEEDAELESRVEDKDHEREEEI